MKRETISLRRRRLMMAGIGAAPAAFLAAQAWAGAGGMGSDLSPRMQTLFISGRVVGPRGDPLAGATVEVRHPKFPGGTANALSDGDGRFMMQVAAAGGVPQAAGYSVTFQGKEIQASLVRFSSRTATGWQRDERGILRTAFAVTVA